MYSAPFSTLLSSMYIIAFWKLPKLVQTKLVYIRCTQIFRCWIESMLGWDISGIWQIWSRFWYETHCQRVEADLGWNMLNKWKRFLSSNICIYSCIFMSAGSSPNHFLSLWRRCFSFWSDSCSKSCDLLRTKNNPATCLLVRPTCTK